MLAASSAECFRLGLVAINRRVGPANS